jgi:hypothetical protein
MKTYIEMGLKLKNLIFISAVCLCTVIWLLIFKHSPKERKLVSFCLFFCPDFLSFRIYFFIIFLHIFNSLTLSLISFLFTLFVLTFFMPHLCQSGETLSELWPSTGLLFIPRMIYEYGALDGTILTAEYRITLTESYSSATLSAANPIWTDSGTNPCLCGERPTTNYLTRHSLHNFLNLPSYSPSA